MMLSRSSVAIPSAGTLNVNASDKVRQIDVLTVSLKKRECNEKIFEGLKELSPGISSLSSGLKVNTVC